MTLPSRLAAVGMLAFSLNAAASSSIMNNYGTCTGKNAYGVDVIVEILTDADLFACSMKPVKAPAVLLFADGSDTDRMTSHQAFVGTFATFKDKMVFRSGGRREYTRLAIPGSNNAGDVRAELTLFYGVTNGGDTSMQLTCNFAQEQCR